jgi:hypothetical protein
MSEAYLKEIEKRISEPGHLKKWVAVGFEGNAAFKKVYDTIWVNTIANAEKNGRSMNFQSPCDELSE